jgi:hypothetical protein
VGASSFLTTGLTASKVRKVRPSRHKFLRSPTAPVSKDSSAPRCRPGETGNTGLFGEVVAPGAAGEVRLFGQPAEGVGKFGGDQALSR